MHNVTGLILVMNEMFSWSKTKHAKEMNFIYAKVNCDFYRNGRWIDSSNTASSVLDPLN